MMKKTNYRSETTFSRLGAQQRVAFLICYMIAGFMTAPLLLFVVFHTYLLVSNKTTIEQYEMTDPLRRARVKLYNLGAERNIRTYCGNSVIAWPLPIRWSIPGDGLDYERNEWISATEALLSEV
mmetsp:Transcript_7513/g.15289  ORF Transcript_7513/g.15289 Transcript_7513/m.15289 type:complete len:124 (+) Transcript_7513:296-667(+)